MKTKAIIKPLTAASVLAVALAVPAGVLAQQPRIFPVEAAVERNEANKAYAAMSEIASEASEELITVQVTYNKIKCGTTKPKSGCGEIHQTMSEKLLKYIGVIQEKLPDIKVALERILEHTRPNIRKAIGDIRFHELESYLRGSGRNVLYSEGGQSKTEGGRKKSTDSMQKGLQDLLKSSLRSRAPDVIRLVDSNMQAKESLELVVALDSELTSLKEEVEISRLMGNSLDDSTLSSFSNVLDIILGKKELITGKDVDPSEPSPILNGDFDECKLRVDC